MTKKQLKQDLFLLITAIISVICLGAVMFHFLEGWHYLDALYFVTMTATTVGYGDFAPTNYLSKIFTIVYSLSIVPFVLYAFSFIAKSQMEKVYSKIHHLERKQKEQEEEIDAAERKLQRQRAKMKEQEEEIEAQERKLKKQIKAIKEQGEEQEKEISEHDQELAVVEDIMEKALTK